MLTKRPEQNTVYHFRSPEWISPSLPYATHSIVHSSYQFILRFLGQSTFVEVDAERDEVTIRSPFAAGLSLEGLRLLLSYRAGIPLAQGWRSSICRLIASISAS